MTLPENSSGAGEALPSDFPLLRRWGLGRALATTFALGTLSLVPITNSAGAAKLECSAGVDPGAVATDESASFAAEATGGKPPYYYNWSFPGGSPPRPRAGCRTSFTMPPALTREP